MLITKIKKNLFNYSITDYSVFLISLFFVIYSLFSSNVPRLFGVEHVLMLSIAILLVCLYIYELRKLNYQEFIKTNILSLIISSIIIYGVVLGITENNQNIHIFRDLIGIISILSIFLLINYRDRGKNYLNFFFKILVYTGLVFSLKTLIFYNFFLDYSNYPEDNPILVAKYHFLYLENTIILCLFFFLFKIYEHTEKKNFYRVIKYTFLLCFPLSVVESYSLRGPIIFIFLIFLIFFSFRNKSFNGLIFSIFFLISTFFVYGALFLFPLYYYIFNTNKKLILIVCSILIILFIFDHIYLWSVNLSDFTHKNILFDHKIKKFSAGLLNNRGLEFLVFQNNFNILDILFGKGLGALHYNPINNSNVLFFHNFSLYYFYKLGVVGILFITLVFLIVITKSYRVYLNFDLLSNLDKCIYFSLLACLGYPLLLSATYRSVSFGFILAFFLIMKIENNDKKNI